MNRRFLVLVGDRCLRTITEDHLLATGLRCRFTSQKVRLLAPPGLRFKTIPNQGIIIGDLFTRAGQDATHLPVLGRHQEQLIEDLLRHYWGEYLVLLFDNQNVEHLRILRDPSGGVPCVYWLKSGSGFITSDISLATDLGLYHREVDWHSVAHDLLYPYRRAERTGLLNVRELLPGCVLRIKRSVTSVRTAWSPWQFVQSDLRHRDPSAAAEEVRTAICTVTSALAKVDRRIILQLSGGLDSSIIAACLADTTAQTIFGSLVVPVAGTDERPYAKLVTDALGQELVSVPIGFEDVRIDFPTSPSTVVPAMGLLHYANSIAWDGLGNASDTSIFYTGGGGDSIFCYLKTAAPAADALRERGIRAGLNAIRELSTLHRCTLWRAAKLTAMKLTRSSIGAWKPNGALLSRNLSSIDADPHPWADAPYDALPGDRERVHELIGTQLYAHATQAPHRLIRRPLLSQPVMEACLKAPSWMWITDGVNRAVARDAFAGALPMEVLTRKSKGSYGGYLAFAYESNKANIRKFLMDGELAENGLVDRHALAALFNSGPSPRDQSFLRAFDLCTAENWVRNQIHGAL